VPYAASRRSASLAPGVDGGLDVVDHHLGAGAGVATEVGDRLEVRGGATGGCRLCTLEAELRQVELIDKRGDCR